MNYNLVKYTSIEIEKEAQIISEISNSLNSYFQNKNYGEGIKEIIIAVICVSKNFEQFFIPNKPKYIKDKKTTKSVHTNQTYEVERCLTYDIKLDFETFKNASEIEAKRIVAKNIMISLNILDEMKSKFKDFNVESFEHDLEVFFTEKELL